ncbi:uncharacterized protein BDZ99DRAFT_479210 [Mytilinidion resinicola]|uniref:Uncharacterized protein n=1 Tax=Mytilinidion resinicola TaxID=574789 RepID=A0A6A6YDL8_9PEZI|nr:uncharacterized protein BDZ99DRAFT_479210 [Mytilinidion resinicola]KAF2806820.1 hypothetical protein BDZ99DRAFT_479210 [Mytilinidion resinicola]
MLQPDPGGDDTALDKFFFAGILQQRESSNTSPNVLPPSHTAKSINVERDVLQWQATRIALPSDYRDPTIRANYSFLALSADQEKPQSAIKAPRHVYDLRNNSIKTMFAGPALQDENVPGCCCCGSSTERRPVSIRVDCRCATSTTMAPNCMSHGGGRRRASTSNTSGYHSRRFAQPASAAKAKPPPMSPATCPICKAAPARLQTALYMATKRCQAAAAAASAALA